MNEVNGFQTPSQSDILLNSQSVKQLISQEINESVTSSR